MKGDCIMKKFLVYGDYAEHNKEYEEFRNDFKVLGVFEAENIEDAKARLIEECSIVDINDIEDNKVTLVEVSNSVEIDLKDLLK